MKHLLLVLVVGLITGCATSGHHKYHYATAHDMCVDPKIAAHFGDYHECIVDAERRHRRVERQAMQEQANNIETASEMGVALHQMTAGLSRSGNAVPVNTESHCTTTVIYGTAYTNCN